MNKINGVQHCMVSPVFSFSRVQIVNPNIQMAQPDKDANVSQRLPTQLTNDVHTMTPRKPKQDIIT